MGGLSPTIKIQTVNQFVILSFGVDPLNWPSYIEIGEIARSTPAWCNLAKRLKTQTSKTASPENVVIAADMLLTGIHVQPEENLVTPSGKLDILLMFAEQTLL